MEEVFFNDIKINIHITIKFWYGSNEVNINTNKHLENRTGLEMKKLVYVISF